MKTKIAGNKAKNKPPQDASLQSVSSKIIRTKSAVRKQYPAKIGYHGTDEEEDLNPEE